MLTTMKSWIKYFIFVAIFGFGINLIYLALPLTMMIVYDRVLLSFSLATLVTLMVGVFFSLVIMGLLEYFRSQLLSQLGNMLVQHVMPVTIDTLHRNAASITRHGYSRGINDLERLRNALVRGQLFSVLDLPWILIYLGILFFIHPLVGGIATACGLMIALFLAILMLLEKKRYTIADVALQSGVDGLRSSLQQAELIFSMGMLRQVRQRYLTRYLQILAIRVKADTFDAAIGAAHRFLVPTSLAMVFGAGAYAFFSNEITTGSIFAMVIITARLLTPFTQCLVNMQAAIEALASFNRLHRYIDLLPRKEKLSLPPFNGRVAVEAVSLVLHGRAVLQQISFTLDPGESMGIIGPSSAGKTSLCKVLLGIWPASVGKVRFDGAEITQWPEEELNPHMGYLPQETALFPATVAENIARLQVPDPDKVVAAAQKAGIHPLVLALPQGYETKIDQTGKNLAAGQRQLISLARALYDAPRLVVLDEPHAHLDDQGINLVFQSIQQLKQEKITTVVVTDRSHILASLDKLLVIRDGQTALYGPTKEVLTQLANRKQPQQATK